MGQSTSQLCLTCRNGSKAVEKQYKLSICALEALRKVLRRDSTVTKPSCVNFLRSAAKRDFFDAPSFGLYSKVSRNRLFGVRVGCKPAGFFGSSSMLLMSFAARFCRSFSAGGSNTPPPIYWKTLRTNSFCLSRSASSTPAPTDPDMPVVGAGARQKVKRRIKFQRNHAPIRDSGRK